jgi:hypothetical protein
VDVPIRATVRKNDIDESSPGHRPGPQLSVWVTWSIYPTSLVCGAPGHSLMISRYRLLR